MWDTETKDLTEKGKDFRKTLAEIMALQDQKGGENGKGAEVMCSLFQEPRSIEPMCRESFVEDYGDIWNPGWVSRREQDSEPQPHPSSCQSKGIWLQDAGQTWRRSGVNEGFTGSWIGGESSVLSISLRGEQDLATSLTGSVLSSSVTPAVNMTHSRAWEGTVTLTCWAFVFSPGNILLTWLWDEEPLSQDAQRVRGQDGGVERRPVALDAQALVPQSSWPTILSVAAVTLVVIIFPCVLWNKKKRTTSAAESPSEKSGQ
ncbi:hypothetical protein HPG69_012692 [Diceros bicornis minor]|uniref:Ig-like domain-containing protein n=1 Tax=Diceros bicornis minor TaxID=77932 RepID=A0A7J7EIF8_DICBM|nr:hypothetical protein HPG69_012692 [Diceros bicornis minor]